jgi:hypothetical protein
MKRLYPHHIHDCRQLSAILSRYLDTLQGAPLRIGMTQISAATAIPVSIFQRLRNCQTPTAVEDTEVTPTDFHILFANLLFRYPTVKMWEDEEDHTVIFEL